MADAIRLLTVLGSVTPPGRLRTALDEALARAPREVEPALIDLASLGLEFVGRAPGEGQDDGEALIGAVEAAEAIVFATPVYRGSMTGALKNVFDALPVEALRDKPVGLVAMGASDHHFLGAERHLRDVLSFFGAFTAPVAVYLTSADFEDGEPGARAAESLDDLLAGVASLAFGLRGGGPLGPPPLAAAAVARA